MSWSFNLGVVLWVVGWCTNVHSDITLCALRKSPGDRKYYIPHSCVFRYVSGANFLGECLEWAGFALAANGSLAPLTFAVFTFANLAPRAAQHHRWYLDKFGEEYARLGRARMIPGVW